MTLRADRIRGLLNAQHRSQGQLDGVTRSELGKWLCGEREPDLADLARLATALHSSSDYLIGVGSAYRDSFDLAAARMSFEYLMLEINISSDVKSHCAKIAADDDLLMREGSPRTLEAWRSVCAMVEIVIRPTPQRVTPIKGA